jgi:hypothetical protein
MVAVHSLNESDALGRPTWSFTIFAGRASALFAVLAGVSIAFITHRRRVRLSTDAGAVAAIAVRALAVGAIGLALGYTDASLASVILPAYAVMFLLAIPLVFLPTWSVAVVAMVVTGGAAVLAHVVMGHLPKPALENPAFADLFGDPGALLSELALTGEFPAVTWLAYLCTGLVIGRLTLSRMRTILVLLGIGAVLAAAAPVASQFLLHYYEGWHQIWLAQPTSGLTAAQTTELLTLGGDGSTPASTWWWLAVDQPHTGTPLDLLGTAGSAIAVLAIMLLAGRAPWPPLRRAIAVLLVPLAAAGSMTLTFYTVHVVFINSALDDFEPMTGYAWQILAMLLVGTAWWATAGRGPLEGLVSVLSRRGGARVIRTVRALRRRAADAFAPASEAGRDPAGLEGSTDTEGKGIEPVKGGGET